MKIIELRWFSYKKKAEKWRNNGLLIDKKMQKNAHEIIDEEIRTVGIDESDL